MAIVQNVLHIMFILGIAVFGFLTCLFIEIYQKLKSNHLKTIAFVMTVLSLAVLVLVMGAEFFAIYRM